MVEWDKIKILTQKRFRKATENLGKKKFYLQAGLVYSPCSSNIWIVILLQNRKNSTWPCSLVWVCEIVSKIEQTLYCINTFSLRIRYMIKSAIACPVATRATFISYKRSKMDLQLFNDPYGAQGWCHLVFPIDVPKLDGATVRRFTLGVNDNDTNFCSILQWNLTHFVNFIS